MFGLEVKTSLILGFAAAFGLLLGFMLAAAILETIFYIFRKIKDFFLP